MLAAALLLALTAPGLTDGAPRLAVAPSKEVVAALRSCIRATREGRSDKASLEAEGWREAEPAGEIGSFFRRSDNAAVIFVASKGELLHDICVVRARLLNVDELDVIAAKMKDDLGSAQRRANKPNVRYGRVARRMVAAEPFEDHSRADGTHVTQIVTGELPKEFK